MFGKGSGDSAAADLAWEEQQAEPRADAAQTMYPLALATGQRPKPAARDVADGVEAWELNFKEDWATMQVRLEEQLRLNPLNHEQKPFSEKTNVSVVDGKNLDGDPCTMVWLPAHEPGTGAGVEKKQNSDHLMACLRKWYLDLPNIVLMVQGGAAHPYSLIQGKQLASDNHDDFLKSRPQFDASYFSENWMSLGHSANSWRNPSFFLPLQHEELRDLHIQPPATLFIDASLQVHDDGEAELIDVGDRTMNEWVMDGVTHQPLGRQAAIKGDGGVFYWDLDAPAPRSGIEGTDLRASYAKWYAGGHHRRVTSRFLVGVTKRKNIDAWQSLVASLLVTKHKFYTSQVQALNQAWITEGEVRVVISGLKLNRQGIAKLASLAEPPEPEPEAEAIGSARASSKSRKGRSPEKRSKSPPLKTPSKAKTKAASPPSSSKGRRGSLAAASSGGGRSAAKSLDALNGETELVLIKLQILGGPVVVSDPVRVSKAATAADAKAKPVEVKMSKSVIYTEENGGLGYLNQRLMSKNPADALVKISLVLATAEGHEARGLDRSFLPDLATFHASLKDLVKDASARNEDTNAHEIDGAVDLYGSAAVAKKAGSKPGSAASQAPTIMLGKLNLRLAFSPPEGVKIHSLAENSEWDPSMREESWQARAPMDGAGASYHAAGVGGVGDGSGSPRAADRMRAWLEGQMQDDDQSASPRALLQSTRLPLAAVLPAPDSERPVVPSGLVHPHHTSLLPGSCPTDRAVTAPQTERGAPSPPLSEGFGAAAAKCLFPQTPAAAPASEAPATGVPPSPPTSPPEGDVDDSEDEDEEGGKGGFSELSLVLAVSQAVVASGKNNKRATVYRQIGSNASRSSSQQKEALRYTVAYWVQWKHIDDVADQLLFFGDARNQPAVVRNKRLGMLIDRQFRPTMYEPNSAGENWQLVVVADDGAFATMYIGHSSDDMSGEPQAVAAETPTPNKSPHYIPTGVDIEMPFSRLLTSGRGAGCLAQAWVWPRDLTHAEVLELWMGSKGRYPRAVGLDAEPEWAVQSNSYGLSTSRSLPAPPSARGRSMSIARAPSTAMVSGPNRLRRASFFRKNRNKSVFGIEKDVDAMLEVPLVNQLAFQRLLNVFGVLINYVKSTDSFLVIDRLQHMSCTAELMLELALRNNQAAPPTVLVLDCQVRLKRANDKLRQLKAANFLRKGVKLQANEYANVSLRQLVTPQGMTWLRASSAELDAVERSLAERPEARRLNTQLVRHIYEQFNDGELQRDGRPRQEMIWTTFYSASLFASGTHYLIFDEVETKGKSLLASLGTVGCVFMSGATAEHAKIIEMCQTGAPLLLLESTGGVTQAFAYCAKAVRLLRAKWTPDYVFRLIADYKARAARDRAQMEGRKQPGLSGGKKILEVENIYLLDRELAKIDLLLSAAEAEEGWMRSFGLPELLMLFEKWQRAPAFLMRQVQTVDVMKKSSEAMLDVYTGCFSAAGGVPELGLGNAETKVVATAWNRHLKLFHNGEKYQSRSLIIQFVLYTVAMTSSTLAILLTSITSLNDVVELNQVMLLLPIVAALLGTVSTRLRQRQKFAAVKMASLEIVSEIYKFRVRAVQYNELALSNMLAAKDAGSAAKKKNPDEEVVAKPVSGQERNKLARTLFVDRVKTIYTTSLATELSSGTSISHSSRSGLDPGKVIRDGDVETERETRKLLQEHVVKKLYRLKNIEWEVGVEAFKDMKARKNRKRRKHMLGRLMFILSCQWARTVATCMRSLCACRKRKARRSELEEAEEGEGGSLASRRAARTAKPASASFLMESEEDPASKPERLDETYCAKDDGEESGGGLSGDDFVGQLSIDDYMLYRVRPACTHLERTAPWRAFEQQFGEIVIFILNASGAVLVGFELTQYVPLTVAIAGIILSFMDYSNLSKQVEAYNGALRDVHNITSEWDGMTRTERRTGKAMTKMVEIVESALLRVGIAETNGELTTLSTSTSDGGGGDGEDAEQETTQKV